MTDAVIVIFSSILDILDIFPLIFFFFLPGTSHLPPKVVYKSPKYATIMIIIMCQLKHYRSRRIDKSNIRQLLEEITPNPHPWPEGFYKFITHELPLQDGKRVHRPGVIFEQLFTPPRLSLPHPDSAAR